MRLSLLLGLAGLLAAGCAKNRKPRAASGPVTANLVRPRDGGTAKVLRVEERLRFVVLDYSLSPIPPFGTVLEVERDGQKVGEVKVTGPASGVTTAADIVNGAIQPGDLARPQ
ncbi:MAG TPA: hypothetical protein VMB21_08620 [Candidatus Limnocylindria bacterium]|jgi:hypothetical protein|nr:hypothetical protein [Candidatus Limnocylindria bacterium]